MMGLSLMIESSGLISLVLCTRLVPIGHFSENQENKEKFQVRCFDAPGISWGIGQTKL
jgi:hypothetical protein